MSRKRVIIAEVDQVGGEACVEALRAAGVSAVRASDVRTTIELCHRDPPQLLVLTHRLGRADCLSLVEAVRKLPGCEAVPIVIGLDPERRDELDWALACEFADYIVEPLEPETLSWRIQFLLHAAQRRSELGERARRAERSLQLARVGDWEWDAHSDIVQISESASILFGLEPRAHRLALHELLDRVSEQDCEQFVRLLHAAREQRTGQLQFDYRVRTAGGKELHVQSRIERSPEDPGRVIGSVADITDRKLIEQRYAFLAYHDMLTGLPNRLLFETQLARAIVEAREASRPLITMLLDLDDFKRITDSIGYGAGDQVIREVAGRLRALLRNNGVDRPADCLARMSADQFMIMLTGLRHNQDAGLVAQRLIAALSEPIQAGNHEVYVSSTIGISQFPIDGTRSDELFKSADVALHCAKRGSFEYYTPAMKQAAMRRLELETQLRRAIERQELVLHYQPKVDVRHGAVIGYEALVRWQHPQLGFVSPGQFIPIAEETGLIVEIGNWVLINACRGIVEMQARTGQKLHIAVNLSTRQLLHADLVENCVAAAQQAGIAPSQVELEITESLLAEDTVRTIDQLSELRRQGFRISLDDFGTGYSSLSYLKKLPLDVLKIDQSFTRQAPQSHQDAAIIRAIIDLAHNLGLEVVAEGVETEAHHDLIVAAGCFVMQGYLFGKPAPLSHVMQPAERA